MESELDFVWRSLRRLGLSDADADDVSLEFQVLPEHTPFDFWVDDVSFVKR